MSVEPLPSLQLLAAVIAATLAPIPATAVELSQAASVSDQSLETVPPGARPMVTTDPPAPVLPSEKASQPEGWKDLVVVDGLVDTYYQYNFTGHTSLTPTIAPQSGVVVRSFDRNSNTFTLGYAKLGFGVAADPVGVRIDVGYGETGQVLNGELASDVTSAAASALSPLVLQQAFASVVLPLPIPVTVDLGKFVSSAGAEVIEANRNWLYSRSILFFNVPALHDGLRITANPTRALTAQVSVVNGWNGVGINPDPSRDKTIGVSVGYSAPTRTSVTLTSYFGKESQQTGFRLLVDLVMTQQLGDRLGLDLNLDFLDDERSPAQGGTYDRFVGASLMARYLVASRLTLAGRGELARNAGTTMGEGTLMIGVPLQHRFEARAEVRADFASAAVFNPDAVTGAASDQHQVTGTVALLGWF